MRTVQIEDLRRELDAVLAAVRKGEHVQIREGDQAVAEMTPATPMSAASLPDWFFNEPPPVFSGGSVLDQLLADRRDSRW
jgi:antitoxin (DNA-binding transcriptional repressor) of toxin-antitoxin stability system